MSHKIRNTKQALGLPRRWVDLWLTQAEEETSWEALAEMAILMLYCSLGQHDLLPPPGGRAGKEKCQVARLALMDHWSGDRKAAAGKDRKGGMPKWQQRGLEEIALIHQALLSQNTGQASGQTEALKKRTGLPWRWGIKHEIRGHMANEWKT